jgi:hypothetical protein
MIAPKDTGGMNAAEVGVVADRLQGILVEYLKPASSMGLKLKGPEVVAVVASLVERVEKGEGVPAFDLTAEGYFLGGLYEELQREESAIFERVTKEDGTKDYAPISRETWLQCLRLLLSRMT